MLFDIVDFEIPTKTSRDISLFIINLSGLKDMIKPSPLTTLYGIIFILFPKLLNERFFKLPSILSINILWISFGIIGFIYSKSVITTYFPVNISIKSFPVSKKPFPKISFPSTYNRTS